MLTRREFGIGALLQIPAIAAHNLVELTEENLKKVNAVLVAEPKQSDRDSARKILTALHNIPEAYHNLVRSAGGRNIITPYFVVPAEFDTSRRINQQLSEIKFTIYDAPSKQAVYTTFIRTPGYAGDSFGGMISHLASESSVLLSHSSEFMRVLAEDKRQRGGFSVGQYLLAKDFGPSFATGYDKEDPQSWTPEQQIAERKFREAFNALHNPSNAYGSSTKFAAKHPEVAAYFNNHRVSLEKNVQ